MDAAGVLQFASMVLLWSESAVMGDVPLANAASTLQDVIRASHFGAVWLAGMLSFVVLLAVLAVVAVLSTSAPG